MDILKINFKTIILIMKKFNFLFALFFSALLFISCSKNENETDGGNPDDGKERILSNYEITHASGDKTIYSFDNHKGIKATENSTTIVNFSYNTDNKISKYTTYQRDGSINDSFEFLYDTNGNLTAVNEKGIYSSFDTYERKLTKNSNLISSEIPHELFSSQKYKIDFKLNSKNLIEELTQTNITTGKFSGSYKFFYDDNENCTKIVIKRLSLGNIIEFERNYTYDNSKNPLYEHHQKSYLAYLLIHGTDNILRNLIEPISTFGKNNIKENNNVYFEYEYNSSNYPTKAVVKYKADNTLSYTTKFNYKN